VAFTSWRGVVGNIKPTMRPGSVEELCRILPEGIGIIPLFLDIQRGAREEFTTILKSYEPMIAKLADPADQHDAYRRERAWHNAHPPFPQRCRSH